MSNNDFTVFKNAMSGLVGGETVEINGTLDWSEPNAFMSWSSTAASGTYAMGGARHKNGVTLDLPMSAGSGIHGPGTEGGGAGPIYFDGNGTDRNWNITGLTISNFDIAIFYSQETNVTDFSGTHVTNNVITVPNAGSTPNGGIILGPSPNQTVQGNQITITGHGGAGNASFGISSFTDGGHTWDNLLIDNNVIHVGTNGFTALSGDTLETVVGISENSDSIGANITVSNNNVHNDATAPNAATNHIAAYDITSESVSATASHAAATVTCNRATRSTVPFDGFVWDPTGGVYDFTPSDYIGITFSNTTLTDVAKGFYAQEGGKATVGSTTITNNGALDYGTAFSADGNGTVITVTDPVSNYTGVQNLKSETNGGQVIFETIGGSIQSVSLPEGNTGRKIFSFPVNLDVAPAPGQEVVVHYATANGTADGNDYNAASGILTFTAGPDVQDRHRLRARRHPERAGRDVHRHAQRRAQAGCGDSRAHFRYGQPQRYRHRNHSQ